MQNKTLDHPDDRKLVWTNGTGSAVAAGEGVVVGSKLYFAHVAIAAAGVGVLYGVGAFKAVKASGFACTVGQKLGWDRTNKRVTVDTSGGAFLTVITAALSADLTVECSIDSQRAEYLTEYTADSTDNTNNYKDFVHGRGVNPTGFFAFVRTAAGVQRAAPTITNQDTNTIRVADAALAAGELIILYAWWN